MKAQYLRMFLEECIKYTIKTVQNAYCKICEVLFIILQAKALMETFGFS